MPEQPTDAATEDPPQFSQWLFSQRNGSLHGEMTDALAELAEAVMATGRPGSLTLTIKVAKAAKGGHQMIVSDQVAMKPPKAERGESLFFFDSTSGGLTRDDPQQQRLPLQEVPRPANAQEA